MQPRVSPYPHRAGSAPGMGAIVDDVDLSNLSDEQFAVVERALYEHKVLVIPKQDTLSPTQQFELVCRFDPEAKRVHGQGNAKDAAAVFKGKQSLLEKPGIPPIPTQPEVRLIGHGPQPKDHWGLPDGLVLSQVSHQMWHVEPLSDDEIKQGFTRWNRWHIDAAFYDLSPPRVTTLHAIKVPQGPPLTVRWDDGSGDELEVQAGATAFVSGSSIYSRLSPELKRIVEHSRVTYAPHPFRKHAGVRGRSNGLGQVSEGKETGLEDLPDYDESKILTYPMLWTNPVTGEKALQVHAIAAWKLHLKDSADGPERTIDDIAEVREFLYKLHRPAFTPDNVFAPPYTEGDLVIFYNRGVMHAATEYCLETHGPRTMHQAHVAGSSHPC